MGTVSKKESDWGLPCMPYQHDCVCQGRYNHCNETPTVSTVASSEAARIGTQAPELEPPNSNAPTMGRVKEPSQGETVQCSPDTSAFEGQLTPTQAHDLRNPEQSDRFKNLSLEERSMLIKAHKNMGHPSPERLSTMLRSQGYRAEVVRAALELKWSACKSQCQPRLARPGNIKDELDFNDRICIDGLQRTNKQGQKIHVYHVVDWSTSFQTACCAPGRSSNAAIQSLLQIWLPRAGAPSEMIVDAATEFNSEEFENSLRVAISK